ncbi:hypothetical protein AB0N89_12275 [Amycolatopsis sp. NPDC089917]|uniref:hypothetical protein n=1 Tax=Amycolatopsis sp. NPDC089917 TaxID=3155187 RepID=UPI0034424CB5
MSNAGDQRGGAVRVGLLVTRAFVVVGGAVAATAAAWLAGDLTACADTADSVPGPSASAVMVEDGQTLLQRQSRLDEVTVQTQSRLLQATEVPSLTRVTAEAEKSLSRVGVSPKHLAGIPRPAVKAVTETVATTRRTAITEAGAAIVREISGTSREPVAVTSSISGMPQTGTDSTVLNSELRKGMSGVGVALESPSRHRGSDDDNAPVSRRHGAVPGKGTVLPPWSPMPVCGSSVTIAAAGATGAAGIGDIPDNATRSLRLVPDTSAVERYCVRAAVIRPGVTPG